MPWLTSRHAILAVLARGGGGSLCVTADASRHPGNREIISQCRTAGIAIKTVNQKWLRDTAGSSARGIAFELRDAGPGESGGAVVLSNWLKEHSGETPTGPILALDHITDPHNLGAILRTAHLLGVPLVILPARRSALAGDVVYRSSAGAAAMVPTAVVPNLRTALEECKRAGWWIYAADAGGESLHVATIDSRAVIVLGAEGSGVSRTIREGADVVLTIPDDAPGGTTVDSFNVSVAAGIVMYELFRRRIAGQ